MEQEHDFPSYWMMFWQLSWFVHNCLKNFHIVPKVYTWFHSYLDFWGYFKLFLHLFMPKLCSFRFKPLRQRIDQDSVHGFLFVDKTYVCKIDNNY